MSLFSVYIKRVCWLIESQHRGGLLSQAWDYGVGKKTAGQMPDEDQQRCCFLRDTSRSIFILCGILFFVSTFTNTIDKMKEIPVIT